VTAARQRIQLTAVALSYVASLAACAAHCVRYQRLPPYYNEYRLHAVALQPPANRSE
jgi:hypothetical protein